MLSTELVFVTSRWKYGFNMRRVNVVMVAGTNGRQNGIVLCRRVNGTEP